MRNTTNKTYLTILLAAAVSVAGYVGSSHADDVQIDASVSFVESLSLTAEEVEFGVFSFSNNAGANEVTLGADDSITCTNTADYDCPASGKAGVVSVAGTAGEMINISCENNAIVSNGTSTLNVEQVRLSIAGLNASCGGLGSTSLSIAIGADAEQNSFKLGAKLMIPANTIEDSGSYSTSNSGGDAIGVKVLYQ